MTEALKLLIVSSAREKAEQVRRVLKQAGLEFQDLFSEPYEDLPAHMESFHPDLILWLPDTISVAEPPESLKTLSKELPLIVITGPEGEEAAVEMLSAGADDYLLSGQLKRLPGLIKKTINSHRWEKMQQEGRQHKIASPNTDGQYRRLFQSGPLPKWIYDRETYRILDVNDTAIRDYGYSREEFLGMDLMALRPVEQLPELFKMLKETKAHTGDFRFRQTRHMRKDGTVFMVEIFGFNLEFQNTSCSLVVCQDITERQAAFDKIRQAEQEARKASEEKEVILESIGDAFWAVDADWNMTYWNKHAAALLNLSKEQVLGKNLWELFPDAVDTSFYSNYLKAIREKRVVAFEEYFERTSHWYEVKAYPSASGLSVYFRNITERKNSELQLQELNRDLQLYAEELIAANKGLEQFSYIVSHNLRSPVANILGLADILRQEEYPPEVRERFQEEMVNNVSRLDTIISDLNAILEIKGDISQKRERVHLQELVNTIGSGISQLIQKEQVQLLTDFAEVQEFSTVRTYLYSIFQNLIYNSIKYRHSERVPKIEISTRRKDGKVFLNFRDNGMGIDLARRGKQVFGLYRRFHNHVDGKGMGLFMVKTQVELIGGIISIRSEVDKGTEFELEFPDDKVN